MAKIIMKKKYWMLVLRLIVSLSLIGFFLLISAHKHGGLGQALNQIAAAFSRAIPVWLLPAGLLHLVGFSLTSLRWQILLKAQGVNTKFHRLFYYYFMANFFNNFLPSTIGGDTIRVIESKRYTNNTTTSVMVVIVERLTGLMALVLIAVTALFIKLLRHSEGHWSILIFLVVIIFCFLFLISIFHPRHAPGLLKLFEKIFPIKIQSKIVQAVTAVSTYYKKPTALLGALGVSIVFQFNMVLYYFLLAKALHQNPNPFEFMLKVPVMIFLLMTVPAINGLGVRTASFKGLMHFSSAFALAIESIDLAFRLSYGMLGGLFFLFYRGIGTRKT